MEENNEAKKSNKSLLVIAFSVLLIDIGVVLIVTGNNKNLFGKKEDKPKEEEPVENDPKRGTLPVALTDEEALALLVQKKQTDFSDQTWSIQNAKVIAHDEKYEKYLVI